MQTRKSLPIPAKMILDVGCGLHPKGHVNVDLHFKESSPDLKNRDVILSRNVRNPVKATVYTLPFKDGSFAKVYSRALIEHLHFPRKAIEEMMRVAKDEIEIIVPHRFVRWGFFAKPDCHVQQFGLSNFRKLVTSFTLPHEIEIIWRYLPHNLIPLVRLPRDLKAKIYLA